MFKDYSDIVSVDDVMKMLQVGKSSVYGLLRSNQIRHCKIGRKYIIPKASVVGFLNNMCYNGDQIIGDRLPNLAKEGAVA